MKRKLAKFHCVVSYHSTSWNDLEGKLRLCSVSAHSDEDYRMDKYFGNITLSFKKGKKRVLVKGEIKADFDDTQDGLWVDWYFVPKPQHQKKLLEVLIVPS